jgi:hypothetical protein
VDLSVADTEEDECAGIEIERVGWIHQSMIMELSNGLTGYMLDSVVTNQTSRTIYAVELELRLPWEDARFEWMPDPRELGNSECYRFPGKNPLEFPRDEVINHLVLAREGLQPKRPLRGLLLATAGPMPKRLRHGQWIDVTLAIITSDHIEHAEIFPLWIDRLEERPARAPREYDLFGEPVGHHIGTMTPAPTEARRGECSERRTGSSTV